MKIFQHEGLVCDVPNDAQAIVYYKDSFGTAWLLAVKDILGSMVAYNEKEWQLTAYDSIEDINSYFNCVISRINHVESIQVKLGDDFKPSKEWLEENPNIVVVEMGKIEAGLCEGRINIVIGNHTANSYYKYSIGYKNNMDRFIWEDIGDEVTAYKTVRKIMKVIKYG